MTRNRITFPALKNKRILSLLSFSIEGSRWNGVHLKRSNGLLQVEKTFSLLIPDDLLAGEARALGEEIKGQLQALGIQERHCVMGLPLRWVMSSHTPLSSLPEKEVGEFLQIEAERNLPADTALLQVRTNRQKGNAGDYATIFAFPNKNLDHLEQALQVANLKPVSFSIALSAVHSTIDGADGYKAAGDKPEASDGIAGELLLQVSDTAIYLSLSSGGGLVSVRALEGVLEGEGANRRIVIDQVLRELRITLGELPSDLRTLLKSVRVLGPRETVDPFLLAARPRLATMNLETDVISSYQSKELGASIAPGTLVSPELSLGARYLVQGKSDLEFLPPKLSAWAQFTTRYSTGKLRRVAVAAGVGLFLIALVVVYQQVQLWNLRSKWSDIKNTVVLLDETQANIRQYRPWFDDTFTSMRILELLTRTFPEDGVVSAKTVEIRESGIVTCTGLARDNTALLNTVKRLRENGQVADLKMDRIQGKSPIQFTFDFRYVTGGTYAN